MNEMSQDLNRKKTLIILIGILLISLLIRLPGILWGVDFEDSKVHRFLHSEETNIRISQELLAEESKFSVSYPAGYGTLLAGFYPVASPAFSSIFGIPVSESMKFVFVGRLLSVILGTATIYLLFLISLKIFDDRAAALFGAFFLCVSGLHVSNSHYATADTLLTFLIYLNIYLCLLCLDKRGFLLICLSCLVSGAAFGTKLSLAAFSSLGFVVYLKMRDLNLGSKLAFVFLGLVFAGVGIFVSNGFYSLDMFRGVYAGVLSDNLFVKEHVKLLNPFFYLFFMIPYMGVVSFFFFLYFIFFLKSKTWFKRRADAYILVLPVLITLLAISSLSIPSMRHALPLVPFMCLIAGLGCALFVQKNISRPLILLVFIVGIVSYQLLYVYSIEIGFVKENRFKASRWFKNNLEFENTSIYISPYNSISVPRGNLVADPNKASYLILSETYYFRFVRSIINPLISYPECGREIYHDPNKDCNFFQMLLKGEGHYDLIKEFKLNPLTPELIIFKKYYGSAAQFAGDIKIYKRREASAESGHNF